MLVEKLEHHQQPHAKLIPSILKWYNVTSSLSCYPTVLVLGRHLTSRDIGLRSNADLTSRGHYAYLLTRL